MDYETISVAIRERTNAEAIDVGFALARRHFAALLAATLVTAAPIALALALALGRWPAAALAAFWWLLPLYERLPLLVVSRAFFGEPASIFRPGSLRGTQLGRHLAGDLTWRRLSPWRLYLAPVRRLEGVRGAALARRLRLVAREGRGAAIGLAAASFAFEIAAWMGLLVLVWLIAREGDLADAVRAVFGEPALWGGPLPFGLYVSAVALLTPFSVCAGFALYINRRVGLEGWDIELVFRRLLRRLTAGPRTAAVVLAAALVLCAVRAPAQPSAAPPSSAEARVAEVIGEVLADEEFGGRRQRTVWRLRGTAAAGERRRGPDLSPLEALATTIADLAPWVLGSVAVVSIGWLFLKGRRVLRRRAEAPARPEPAGGDGEPLPAREPLPGDWPEAAGRCWDAGDAAQALSLLYRGVLETLALRSGFEVAASLTERECLELLRGAAAESDARSVFERVAQAWLRTAYAQAAPDPALFAELRGQAAALREGE